jgi:hypothetical protein
VRRKESAKVPVLERHGIVIPRHVPSARNDIGIAVRVAGWDQASALSLFGPKPGNLCEVVPFRSLFLFRLFELKDLRK